MCNRYGYPHPYHRLVEEFSETRIPILWPEPSATPNLPARPMLRPLPAGSLTVEREEPAAPLRAVASGRRTA